MIDGKALAAKIVENMQVKIDLLKSQGVIFGLAIITLGPDFSWKTYVRQKIKLAEKLGVKTRLINIKHPSEKELLRVINQLNSDASVHGIIVQRPFAQGIDKERVIGAIKTEKDIDGFRQDTPFEVPVWKAVKHILEYTHSQLHKKGSFQKWLQNQSIVEIGYGETAGYPIVNGLQRMGINPLVITSGSKNTRKHLKNADIIISAVGKRVVRAKDLKPGVILVGVGLNRGEDKKLHGDYDENDAKSIACFYTPTPGGVGPINLAYLFQNLISTHT